MAFDKDRIKKIDENIWNCDNHFDTYERGALKVNGQTLFSNFEKISKIF